MKLIGVTPPGSSKLVAMFALMLVCAHGALGAGNVTVTKATGGTAISADTAGATYTTLSGPTITESAAGTIGTGTIILHAPVGFVFNTANPVTATVSKASGPNGTRMTLASSTATVTTSTITISVTAKSNSEIDQITWSGIQVRPTAGTPLASGNITETGTSSFAYASGSSASNYGTLTEIGGAANQLVLTQQPSATATAGSPFAQQPTLTVQDQFGNPGSGTVTATETSGGNLNATTIPQTVVISSGVASFSGLFVTNAASSVTLTFISGSLSTTSSAISVSPASPSKLAVTTQPSPSATAGTPFTIQPQVIVLDAYGNLPGSDGTTITAAETSGGNLNATTTGQTVDISGGVASFNGLFVTNAGTITLIFSAPGLSSATSSAINVGPLAANALTVETAANGNGAIVSARNVTAGTSLPVYSISRDIYGNFLGNPSSTWSLTAITGGVVASDLTPPNGTSATFIGHLVGTAQISATSGAFNGSSGTLTVIPGTATKLAVTTQPASTALAGQAFATQPAVTVQDANGNTVTSYATAVTARETSGGNLNATTTAQTAIPANGVATFSGLFVTNAAAVTLTFTSGTLTSAVSAGVDVSAAAPTKLVFSTAPVTVSAGIPSGTITVQRRDQYGNGNTTEATRTVTLSSSSTGTVTFNPASLSINPGSSSASFTYTDNKAGTPAITAASSSPSPITSATQTETVSAATTTTAVSSSAPSSVFGQTIILTATVTATNGLTPTGTITFKDGATTLGTSTLNGSAQTTFTNSSFTVASHSITAVYGGDTTFNGSTSPALTQTVSKANTSVALISSVNPTCAGQSILFTATVSVVSPGAGTPTGSVTFKDGATTLSTITLSSGVATFSSSALSGGAHSITALYNGSTSFNTSTSAALPQTVNTLPTAIVSGGGNICLGGGTNIQAALTGTGPWTVTWSDGVTQNGVAVSPATRFVSPASTTTYAVTSVSDSHCSNTGNGNATVTVNIPPAINSQPTSKTLCAGGPAVFSVGATGSGLTYQWLKNGSNLSNGGNVSGATTATLTINPTTTGNSGSYSVVVSGVCSPSVTSSSATLTVNPTPNPTISVASAVCASTANNIASVADAGPGAGYGWTITGGTITSGAGTPNITFTAGSSGTISLKANVTNLLGCWASSTSSVIIPVPVRMIDAWKNSTPLRWQGSTFNKGDAYYSEGATIPLRFILTNMCPGGAWSINLVYDFKDVSTAGHFWDFLTTYNSSEQTELGSECASYGCSGPPSTFPIPADPALVYQLPGEFTIYNGTITNVSPVATVQHSGSTIQKQYTISGVTAPGSAAQNVLIVVGGHLAGELQWGPANGAASWSGASGKIYLQFTDDSSFESFAINPANIAQLGDLSIASMTGTPGPVCAGSTINYSLTLSNAGPQQAQSVIVQDNLPPGMTLVSATMSQGTVTGTTNLSFSLGDINVSSNATISMVVSVSPNAPAGTFVNTATVSAASPTDPNFNNNSLSASTIVYARTTASPLSDQLGCQAIPTTFATVASGTGPFTYQWRKNGSNISGATSALYTIPSVQASDAGTYCVVVTGTCNSVTNCANLIVSTNTSIATPLVSLVKCPGETAVFSTVPSGTGPFTISWTKNGVLIPGQTGTTLTLPNLSASDAGLYCVNISGYCNATNNCATLSVNSQVQVISSPADQTACPGSNVTFTVNATGSSLTYRWYAGTNLLSGQTDSSLTLTNVSATNAVSYRVVVTGACGNAVTNTASLTLTLPAVTAPADISLACTNSLDPSLNPTLGIATVTESCGTLTPTYSDQIIPGNCPGNYTVKRTWTVQDGFGNVSTALQIITVQDTAPVVLAPPNLVLAYTADTSTNSTGVATVQAGCGPVALGYSDVVTAQVDGSQVIARTWVASDNCGNAAGAVQTITLNAPLALVLPTQSDMAVTNSTTLMVSNTANNPNGSTNALTYQLINPPLGASIDNNGVITWTPTLGESPSTNVIITVVTTTVVNSTGSFTISTTNSFVVTVSGMYDELDMLVDTDGDGLTNLVEYAVGSDPRNSGDGNSGIIVWITENNGSRYLAMKFKRRVNAAALQLQYRPEVSADKAIWYWDDANVLELSVTPFDSQFDWVTVRDATPITPPEARFIRLDIISTTLESASPTWIGTATPVKGNGGTGAKFTTFSQRMVLPIVYAGTISSLQNTALTDANAAWANAQFGSASNPVYAEFDNGYMVDIAGTASSQSLALAGSVSGLVNPGDTYRVRQHFTIASMFGTNNETGLKVGLNPASADNIMLTIPETQQVMSIFYFSNAVAHGWYRADFTPAADQVIYPEQGVMVRRIVPGDVNVYLCGPIKTDATVAPIEPGFNNVGTLKSLSTMTLNSLNLYTGNPATGIAAGLNLGASDNVLIVQPNGSTASYFYFKDAKGNEGWLDARFSPAGNVSVPAGSALFIKRQLSSGAFDWTIPAE